MKNELIPPIHAKLKKAGITFNQYVALYAIGKGVINPSKLAEVCLVTCAAITGILDLLENKHLLDRIREGPDRRKVSLSLTTKGLALLRAVQE